MLSEAVNEEKHLENEAVVILGGFMNLNCVIIGERSGRSFRINRYAHGEIRKCPARDGGDYARFGQRMGRLGITEY